MDVEYMRTAKKSYMIVKNADFPFEQYELTMILQNEISCLLSLQTMLTDGTAEYWYDVSGMQSMGTRFQLESMDGKQLRSFLESFLKMKSDMEEYLLDDSNLCFSSDMIYFDRSGERIRFCYIPGLSSLGPAGPGVQSATGPGSCAMPGMVDRRGSDLKGLFEEILQHLNHSDPAAVRMGYEMYERSVSSSFTLQDCLDCLQLGESVAEKLPDLSIAEQDLQWRNPAPKSVPERTDFEDGEEIEFLFEEPERKTGHRRKRENRRNPGWERGKEKDKEKEKRRRRFRENEPEEEELLFALRPEPPEREKDHGVAQETGRTEVIADDEHLSKAWELVYKGDGMESDIVLRDFPFLVGSDINRVNAALRARTVSRVHAKFYLREERLFVEDFNSTNGTYLNQSLLPMNTPTELAEGDRIVFATEEYVVYRRRTVEPPGF